MTEPDPQIPLDIDEVRRRQRARARITGLALGALAVLFFLITLAKLTVNR